MYQALKVGSVEPLATASLWLVSDCWMVSRAACRSGRASSAICRKSSSGCKRIGKIEGPVDVELLHRRAVVQQLQQLNLGRAQIDDGRLEFRLVLHAQQLDAVEIDLRQCRRP